MSEQVREFTSDNFEAEVMQSDQPVLVDFWAPWCGPCRAVAPIVEELATSYAGRLKVGKINTDEHPQVASRFGISSIPTLLIFKGGEIVGQQIGVVPKAQLEQNIANAIG